MAGWLVNCRRCYAYDGHAVKRGATVRHSLTMAFAVSWFLFSSSLRIPPFCASLWYVCVVGIPVRAYMQCCEYHSGGNKDEGNTAIDASGTLRSGD